ncbi:PREDICTED: basic salivary proline-rich protein 2-like [Galeopterus variegatus]|uniref:Basic salivary proline-rich protein 2-like n=1 Tax=Galeopterus variegatus TaxID=482537 RepID=A0ABM0Q2B6_GALVR|nr:PREDICTED: basic salivary proline-rich protein 2-like [Galeopterus variegatus]
MAVDFGDHASGFRHREVIKFINNEVLMNGGGPDFYLAFRSRPWNEVEDQLRAILTDPQVPRSLKRVCTWSGLALSVRVAARQQEQQSCRIRQLQQQVEEREAATWALATQLQRLRMERDESVQQLRATQAALQQAKDERDMLRRKLLRAEGSSQADSLAHEIKPGLRVEQQGAAAWPQNVEPQREVVATRAHGRLYCESQMPAPAAVVYMRGPPGSWAQPMHPPMPMPVPPPFPLHPPFVMGSPFVPPQPPGLVTETETSVVPLQMSGMGVYPPGPCTAVGFQAMVSQGDQRSYVQEEGSKSFQGSAPLGDSRSHSQEKGPEMPQGMAALGESSDHTQEEGPEMPQGMAALGDSSDHSQKEGTEVPQRMPPLGDSGHRSLEEDPERPQGESQSQEEGPERPQKVVPFGDSGSQSQEEDPERPQKTIPLGSSRSHSQEESPERPQATSLRSQDVKGSPKKQQPQGQKAKQPKGKKASKSPQQEKAAPGYSPEKWDCPWCKAMNFSWRTFCYKCKKVYMPVESGGLDPGQTH